MSRPFPPQRFVIRRMAMGSKSKLPWCLYDKERPHYVGRFPTWMQARDASVGEPGLDIFLIRMKNIIRGNFRFQRDPDDYALS